MHLRNLIPQTELAATEPPARFGAASGADKFLTVNFRSFLHKLGTQFCTSLYDTVFGSNFFCFHPRARATALKLDLELERWSVADAAELYEVARWGNGYLSVNGEGHVGV